MYRSSATVGASEARQLYKASGEGVVWAVVGSGIDETHPHFRMHANLELPRSLAHQDLTVDPGASGAPLTDENGFGTHVAGIVAGEIAEHDGPVVVATHSWTDTGERIWQPVTVRAIAGIAPRCKLLSIKVLEANGSGRASTLVSALDAIQQMNGYGRRIQVHGVLLGVTYEFDPDRFACGHSPICVEVDRLVRSGVVVVAAAGDTGHGVLKTDVRGAVKANLEATISDPGNAELAITVGSTHRDLPHEYGVSWFSAKGPTADGRMKPELLAPGQDVASCAAGQHLKYAQAAAVDCRYFEDTGTAVAAAHVAGVAAALLSVRPQLVGHPEEMKDAVLASATDLGREPTYQGRGMVNLLEALRITAGGRKAPPSSNRGERRKDDSEHATRPAIETQTRKPVRLMCSYSHKDSVLLDELKTHLSPLKRQRLLESWQDREILPGSEWQAEIARELNAADIILLLISSDFVASDYCYDIEMERAIERHDAGTVRVIPVIVREVDWAGTPFSKLKALPRDGKAVTKWQNQDEAWADVAKEIRRVIESMRK
jgi:subtilisin family serine protease